MAEEKANLWVAHYAGMLEEDWSDLMAKFGYDDIERDVSSDGRWHDGVRRFGKVAFWDEEKDGFVLEEVKFRGPDGQNTHGTGAHAVGDAYQHIRNVGYRGRASDGKIEVNGEVYEAREINSMDLRNVLKKDMSDLKYINREERESESEGYFDFLPF